MADTTDPVTHKEYTECAKCYKNLDFLNSGDARYLRILCEYEEPLHRLAKNGVKGALLLLLILLLLILMLLLLLLPLLLLLLLLSSQLLYPYTNPPYTQPPCWSSALPGPSPRRSTTC
jgi:hypothetical protein